MAETAAGSDGDDDVETYVPLKQRRAMEEARRAAKRGRAAVSTTSVAAFNAVDAAPATAVPTYDFGPGARAGESLFDQARRAMEAGEAPTELDKQRTLEREIMAQVATMAVPRYAMPYPMLGCYGKSNGDAPRVRFAALSLRRSTRRVSSTQRRWRQTGARRGTSAP